jgi:hypothetical protein
MIDYDRMPRVELFAAANGWKVTRRRLITLNDLAGIEAWDPGPLDPRFDHPSSFTRDRRPVAIMAENYEHDRDELREAAKDWDRLALHEPPAQRRASLYNPFLGADDEHGGTWPQVVTHADHPPIVWPTEMEMAETVYLHHKWVQDVARRAALRRAARSA